MLERARRRWLDAAVTIAAGVGICFPAGVVAVLLLYAGAGPAAGLALILSPRLFRYVRNLLAAASEKPHVWAARARGAGPAVLLFRHVGLPVVPELLTLLGVSVGMALGTIIPVEALCDSPGLGQLVWQSAMARDLPVLIHLTAMLAVLVCGANLVSDGARSLAVREH
jgi:peptide/nickel transport system permease protein